MKVELIKGVPRPKKLESDEHPTVGVMGGCRVVKVVMFEEDISSSEALDDTVVLDTATKGSGGV